MKYWTAVAGAVLWGVLVTTAASAQDIKPDSKQVVSATLISLNRIDASIGEILDTIAKEMGYAGAVLQEDEDRRQIDSFSFHNKPSWECLVEIFKKHHFTFGNGGIGADPRMLHVFRAGETDYTYCPNGPFLVRLWQKPIGTTIQHPTHLPLGISLLAEPKTEWSCTGIEALEQKNAKGEACDLIGFEIFSGRPQLERATQPWPGLRCVTLKTQMEIATDVIRETLPSLTGIKFPHVVNDRAGQELFTLEALRTGARVQMVVSFPSTDESSGVAQGGWGTTSEELGLETGERIAIEGKDGRYAGPTVSHKGDGKRMTVTFSYTSHELKEMGGLENLKLTFTKPVKKASQEFKFQLETGL